MTNPEVHLQDLAPRDFIERVSKLLGARVLRWLQSNGVGAVVTKGDEVVLAHIVKKYVQQACCTSTLQKIITGSRFAVDDVQPGGLLYMEQADLIWDLPLGSHSWDDRRALRSSEYCQRVLAHALLCAEVYSQLVIEGWFRDIGHPDVLDQDRVYAEHIGRLWRMRSQIR